MQIRHQDRKRQSKGEYDGIIDRAGCAYTLTGHLREVSRDEHLEVTPSETDPTAGVKTLIGEIQRKPEVPKAIARTTCLQRCSRKFPLAPYTGRSACPVALAIPTCRGFPPPEFGAEAAAASEMNELDDTSTLIFDFLNRLKSSGKFESLRQRRAGV